MAAQDSTTRGRKGRTAGDNGPDPGIDFDLAIVGGGFSGLCTAWHLLTDKRLPPSFNCVVIEPCERLGAGLAYRTDSPRHLLNVRAKGMSITEGDPGSFARWLATAAPEFSPADFAPRGLYRRYINDCLSRARAQRPDTLTVLRDEVRAVEEKTGAGRYRLELQSGRTILARSVVLAIGNLPPKAERYTDLLCPPWGLHTDYRRLETLAIVGAGLTALDVILEAEASGFAGRYTVVSPRGQFPLPHGEPHLPVPPELHTWAAELAAERPRLRALLHAFQRRRKAGCGWEQLVDALRRHAPSIWSRLSPDDKRRFLRHLRMPWNLHLHRSCHRSMEVVKRLEETGRLHLVAARVTGAERCAGAAGPAVRLRLQHGPAPALDADLAVNGTGLFCDILRTESPLVAQLIAGRLATPDEFHLGLKVNGAGQLISADGLEQPGLFTVGTLRRGAELECTAVPEIRRQVRVMAEELIRLLAGDTGSH